jgi:cell division cycle 2-like
MALSAAEGSDMDWPDEDLSSLTRSGHLLREEHINTWADANQLNLPLEELFGEVGEIVKSGVALAGQFPGFPCFWCVIEMGEHLNLPWKTVATALNLLWRYAKTQIAKSSGKDLTNQPRTIKPTPTPLTPLPSFLSFFSSLSSTRIHVLAYGCLLLASKLEETLFSLRNLQELHLSYLTIRGKQGCESWRMKDTDISLADPNWLSTTVKEQEVELLVELGFNLTIRHLGYYRLLRLMNTLKIPSDIQTLAISLANVSLLTPNVLIHRPKLFAVAMLYVAAQIRNYPITIPDTLLPSHRPHPQFWWSGFNVSTTDITIIASPILTLLRGLGQRLIGDAQIIWTPNENELSQLRSLNLDVIRNSEPPLFCHVSSLVETADPITEQMFHRCRDINCYEKEKKISEGTYGTVYVGRETKTGEIVAIKKMKRTLSRSGFPYYMLREILFLFRLDHKNIVEGRAMVIDEKGEEIVFYIVMEFISTDMLSLVKYQASIPREHRIRLSQVKNLMVQLLSALAHMHEQGLMHRDLKLANLLLTKDGTLKVADLGSIRDIGRTSLKLTTQIVTLWYRPPELLMGGTEYTHAVDLWSVGCLFCELLTLKPLFPGNSEVETMYRIFKILGHPSQDMWIRLFKYLPLAPKLSDHLQRFPAHSTLKDMLSFLSPAGHHFLASVLAYDPAQRISAKEALAHPFWYEKPVAQPVNLEKIGMVTVYDERNLEAEMEAASLADSNENLKSKYDFLKKV